MKSLLVALLLVLAQGTAPAGESRDIDHGQNYQGGVNHHVAGHAAMDHDGINGSGHKMPLGSNSRTAVPVQPGQGAFAAIQEIVEFLEADPNTDWSKVDIGRLRRHLVDMDNVTLRARAAGEAMPRGMRYTITGDGEVAESIKRMVLAHAATMDGAGGWHFTAEPIANGAVLTVESDTPAEFEMIRALGFLGAMTRGAHHQVHHLMIARGMAPHK